MSEFLWHKDEIYEALDGKLLQGHLADIDGISIDSRDIQKGDAFFAIKGDQFDGHAFCQKAADNGADLLVVSHQDFEINNPDVAIVLVDDVVKSLERLGMAARARNHGKIIAVTGSVGKTSTKEFLKACLSQFGKTHASVKSFNNHWGVPITLSRMPRDAEYSIFEIGMNHLNEISPLVKMVEPEIAIITTVAPAHLGHFKNIEEIALAKSEIFDGLKKDGFAILNYDNPHFEFLKEKAKSLSIEHIRKFGEKAGSDLRLLSVEANSDHSIAKIEHASKNYEYKISSAGTHQVMNSLSLLLVIAELGLDLEMASKSLENISLSDGRGAQSMIDFKGGQIKLIDESYNANPASMEAAFRVLDAQKGHQGRNVAIIGDMLELGVHAEKLHEDLAFSLNKLNIDQVFACGELMKHCYQKLDDAKAADYQENALILSQTILDKLQPNDVVMIKGSLGSKMSQIVNVIKNNGKVV